MNNERLYKKFRGAIWGTVIGDAIGENFGSRSRDYIEGELRKKETIRYTDDTVMTFGICQQLIENGRIDVENLADIFMYDHLANLDRAYGTGAYFLFNIRKDTEGVKIKKLNRVVSDLLFKNKTGSMGNGACMRAAPVGLWYNGKSDFIIRKAAAETAVTTHIHKLGIDSAVIMAKAVSLAVTQEDIVDHDFIDSLIRISRTKEFKAALLKVKLLLKSNPDKKEIKRAFLRNELAVESLPYSIYVFLKNRESFEDCLYEAIALDGDTDTIAAMACALSGAYLGIDSIPEDFMYAIENKEFINRLCEYFHDAYEGQIAHTAADFRKYKDDYFPAVLLEENEKVGYRGIKVLKIVKAMKAL